MTGVVKKMFKDKGFAFIEGSDGLTRFMHVKHVVPRIAFDLMNEGDAVEFVPTEEVGRGNGLRAEQVKCLSPKS